MVITLQLITVFLIIQRISSKVTYLFEGILNFKYCTRTMLKLHSMNLYL